MLKAPAIHLIPRVMTLATALCATNFNLASGPKTPKISQLLSKQLVPEVLWCPVRIKKCIYMTWGHKTSFCQFFFTPPSFVNFLDHEHQNPAITSALLQFHPQSSNFVRISFPNLGLLVIWATRSMPPTLPTTSIHFPQAQMDHIHSPAEKPLIFYKIACVYSSKLSIA